MTTGDDWGVDDDWGGGDWGDLKGFPKHLSWVWGGDDWGGDDWGGDDWGGEDWGVDDCGEVTTVGR